MLGQFRKQMFGPVIIGDHVLFQLWAPDAKRVTLLLDEGNCYAMTRGAEGFWRASCPATVGTRYRFDVDELLVADPASRYQPDDVDGPSEVYDPCNFAWQCNEWRGRPLREVVIYEAHVGASGGYDALARRLPALAKIGVTAVELMPLADFAGARNWGYDGVLPFAPESAYGAPENLQALIDAAHGLGLMVYLDVVYNHFGPQGNYLPAYAKAFFDQGIATPWGAAIDFRNPIVRRFFIENALYWLGGFRFDGLRFDAVHAISDKSWLPEVALEIRDGFPNRQIHLFVENEDNDATLLRGNFDAQWNDDFHNVMHVLLTGERHAYYAGFAASPAEKLAKCLAEGFIYQGDIAAANGGRPRGQPSAELPPTAFINFLQNHDQIGNRALGERLTVLAEPRALRAAMALLLLCPQIPLLFAGEEFGAQEPFLFFTDYTGALAADVREGRRREFTNAPGFNSQSAAAGIPDPNDPATFNRSIWTEGAPDAAEWYGLIQHLLTLRRDHIVPYLDATRAIGACVLAEQAVRAAWRLHDDTELIVACNLGRAALPADCLPTAAPLFGAQPITAELGAYTTCAWILPAYV
jgi:maltooligosyltrehalose trehalohydrolase